MIGKQARNFLFLLGAIGVPLLAQFLANRFGVDDYRQGTLYQIGLNVTLAVSLSLIIGFAGQFSLGHAGFMSVGAFSSALFTTYVISRLVSTVDVDYLGGDSTSAAALRYGLLALVVLSGVIAASAASFLVGLPSLRLRGDYLAIATLGFGEITYNLLLVYLQRNYFDTAYYLDSSMNFMQKSINFGTSWALALLAILVVRNLVSSTSGRSLPAIREDEIAAGAVGIRTTRFKMVAFMVSALLAGAAGTLEAHRISTVNPASYRFDRSIEMIVPVVLGGSGSLTGCVLAAIGFTWLSEWLRGLPGEQQQYRVVIYAVSLVLIMLLRPQGLMGRFELRDLWTIIRGRRATSKLVSDSGKNTAAASLTCADSQPLTCSNLTIRFGGLTAVKDFNLCLKPGEIVGLIGPNGAGKTTCFNMITGIYRPTSGGIRLGDRSLVGRDCAATNNLGIARTFQNIRLFRDLSVHDNVRVALQAHLKKGLLAGILRTPGFYREEARTNQTADKLLDLFDLSAVAEEPAGSLPYGDQRRLEIARALATKPMVLCLDEPAAGMNPAEKRELMNLIRRIRDEFKLTVLLIEHDMKVVMGVCERIVVLDHGETIAEGAPEVIRNHPKVIEAYLGETMKTEALH